MKRLFLLLAICSLMTAGCCNNRNDGSTHIRYRYATAEEGRQLRLANTAYIDGTNQNNIDWKLRCSGKTLDDYKAIAAAQIVDFTDEEKQAVDATMAYIEARFDELGINLRYDDEIVFIKTNMKDEGEAAGGYTLQNQIYLHQNTIEGIVDAWKGNPALAPGYLEYCTYYSHAIVAHELFHCLTRNDAAFREQMYRLIGFTVMDHEIEFGPTVREMLLHNPDVERYDNWAEFTIDGQKRRCILISVYRCNFAEAVATNPDAAFFDYLDSVLVPLDEPDTMIPIAQASDFYDIVGHNTNYILAAEEDLAENFSYMISDGFYGLHDYWNDKFDFIPYKTPQLIRNICSTLQSYYN